MVLILLGKTLVGVPQGSVQGRLQNISIRNKFSGCKYLALKETDVCLLSETKIDDSFPNSQFFVGYRMCRKERNKNSGGLIHK